jgi:L,D-transpeptidase catalytic domain
MHTRHHGASSSLRQAKETVLGSVSAFGTIMALALALGISPAAARTKIKALHREVDRTTSEPFGNAPKGPVQIFVSINQQKLHVYSDGTHVADTSVATGVPKLPTPTGVFSVIQKQVFHRSNLYSDAPMPFMQRITWSGVAMHEGENIGHPASHGCIRMPGEFAARLYKFTRIGARVIVARGELKPEDFADPHLFVHKDMQAAASPPAVSAVQTAQSIDRSTASDAGPADVAITAKPADLGLRGSKPNVTASFVLDTPEAAKPDSAKPDIAAADAAKPEVTPADAAKADAPKVDAPVAADEKAPAALSSDPKAEAPVATGSTPAVTPVIAAPETPAAPLAKPADIAKSAPIKKSPIAIFVSRKEKKIFVRQDFEPVFEEAITIEHPEQPLGTHVFTAMEYLADNATFRWNVVSMPGEPPKASMPARVSRLVADDDRYGRRDRRAMDRRAMDRRDMDRRAMARHGNDDDQQTGELPPPQTPQQALARIDLPQDAIDFISQRMVPGSSMIVSDQGLGDETGEGTDFIVVTR